MADDPAAAGDPAATPESAPQGADPALATQAPARSAKASATPAQAADDGKSEQLTALIRNHYTNTALSRDLVAWACFEAGLPALVTAILEG